MSTKPVKSRRYDASRRQQQAAEARRAVLTVARRLLLRHGYARTTVPAVASAAGVSAEFVYKNIGAKPALLAAVLDVAVGGDDVPMGFVERDSIARLRTLTSAGEVVEGYVRVMAQVQVRVAPLLLLASQSADPEAADLIIKADADRVVGMTGLAQHLHRLGGLRPDATVDTTRDVLWTYTSAHLYDMLVGRRGWSLEQYERFVREALVAALLAS